VERIVTFNTCRLKSMKCWYLLFSSSTLCQLCMIRVICNNCIMLTFLTGIYYKLSVEVLLLYISHVLSFSFLGGV
jgi:hypothetical protein